MKRAQLFGFFHDFYSILFFLKITVQLLCFNSSLMPSLLTTMKNTSELVSGEVYLLSALAALQKVVETLPHFISPYLEGVLSQVSHSDLNMFSGGGGENYKPNNFIL